MDSVRLKHILRKMKRDEKRLYGDRMPASLVYSRFFIGSDALYPLSFLLKMEEGALHMVMEEYWADVLYTYFTMWGTGEIQHDPKLLKVLGLSIGATEATIKKRFRRLAHRYHPDHGGCADAFMAIKEAYDQLMSP